MTLIGFANLLSAKVLYTNLQQTGEDSEPQNVRLPCVIVNSWFIHYNEKRPCDTYSMSPNFPQMVLCVYRFPPSFQILVETEYVLAPHLPGGWSPFPLISVCGSLNMVKTISICMLLPQETRHSQVSPLRGIEGGWSLGMVVWGWLQAQRGAFGWAHPFYMKECRRVGKILGQRFWGSREYKIIPLFPQKHCATHCRNYFRVTMYNVHTVYCGTKGDCDLKQCYLIKARENM